MSSQWELLQFGVSDHEPSKISTQNLEGEAFSRCERC